jgi:hypothetical protein
MNLLCSVVLLFAWFGGFLSNLVGTMPVLEGSKQQKAAFSSPISSMSSFRSFSTIAFLPDVKAKFIYYILKYT